MEEHVFFKWPLLSGGGSPCLNLVQVSAFSAQCQSPAFLPRGPQSSALLDIPTGLSTSPNSDKTEAANTDADIEDGLVETVGEGEGKV